MKSLCACPAASIDSQYSTDLPLHFIGYQYLLCLFVTLVLPQNHYPHFMIYSRYLHSLCEIPLPFLANQYFFARFQWYLFGHLADLEFLAHKHHVPVELQIAHVPTLIFVYVIENRHAAEIAVEREIPRYHLPHHPINQLFEQFRMVLEFRQATGILFIESGGKQLNERLFTVLPLSEQSKIQRIMLTRWTDVVCYQIIMRDLVPRLRVIPVISHIFDELPAVIYQS